MARGYMPGGGSGSATSDDCTATKAQVLDGYTAVTSDSDDEAVEGTMPNRGNQQKATSVTTGNNNMYFRTPAGYYSATGSEEADKPEVYAPYSDVASKGGVTSAKLLAGQSALGISGTATSDANAVASDMASGKSGYVKGKKVTGNLSVFGAGPTKAPAGWNDSDKVYFSISRGIYNTLAPGDPNYAQVYRLKSELGITAGKIAQGQSICGVNGNYTNDATAVAADIAPGKTAYVKGSKITGSGITMYYLNRQIHNQHYNFRDDYNFTVFDNSSDYDTYLVKVVVQYDSPGGGIAGRNETWIGLLCETNKTSYYFLSSDTGDDYKNSFRMYPATYNGNTMGFSFSMYKSHHASSTDKHYEQGTVTITLLYGIRNLDL